MTTCEQQTIRFGRAHVLALNQGPHPKVCVCVSQFQFEVGLLIAVTLSSLVCLSRVYTGMHSVLVSHFLHTHTHLKYAYLLTFQELISKMILLCHCFSITTTFCDCSTPIRQNIRPTPGELNSTDYLIMFLSEIWVLALMWM